MKTISISTAMMIRMKGITARQISLSGSRKTDMATNRFSPMGGVRKPISRLTTMMMPRWIGLIP